MMCIQKTEIGVFRRKKKKKKKALFEHYASVVHSAVYTEVDFKKDIDLFFSLSYMAEIQGNFTLIKFTWG